jgi:hypothetical protein
MTEENMNKVYWIAAFLVIMIGLKSFVIDPSYAKVKAQQSGITGISYTAPTS